MRFPPSSTALFHYIDPVGLETRAVPQPADARPRPSTVVDLKGESPLRAHARRPAAGVPRRRGRLERRAGGAARLLRHARGRSATRDVAAHQGDLGRSSSSGSTTRRSTASSATSPHFTSFRHREIFGQVGFGTGGWDTDFPNSILEILRVVYTEADDEHRGIVGGQPAAAACGSGTATPDKHRALAGRHVAARPARRRQPRPAVTRLHRTAGNRITRHRRRRARSARTRRPSSPPQSWMLLTAIACDEALFPIDHWTAMERTHYMESSKLFVLGRPAVLAGPGPGDRPRRDEHDADRPDDPRHLPARPRAATGPAVICLSYTWCDDSLKWLPLSADERMEVDARRRCARSTRRSTSAATSSAPRSRVSWETRAVTSWARSRPTCPATTATSGGCSPTSCRGLAAAPARALPRRRRHLLDGGLGRGRRADRAQRGVGRHAPPRRRDAPGQPGARRPVRRDRAGGRS